MALRGFTIKGVVAAVLVVATGCLGAVTLQAASVAGGRVQGSRLDASAPAHLAYLRTALEAGAGERMQALFPEGYFFSYVLYGLSWTELGARRRVNAGMAQVQAQWALDRLSTDEGTAPFDSSLRPAYGIFYAGWTLLLRSKLAALAPVSISDRSRIRAEADEIATALAASLGGSGSPFLQAYPGGSWPVDTVVAVAALRAADATAGTDHRALIGRWLAALPGFADPGTGLLPHHVDALTGRPLEGARGSSQSVIQRFWPSIDPRGSAESYRRYRQLFTTREIGFVGVREFPRGVRGPGDVDSGPLVLGLSLSASVVAIGAAQANGDPSLAGALAGEAEVLGVPVTWDGQRRYAAGRLPVGDAFVVWARVTAPAPPAGGLAPARPRWLWWLGAPWIVLLSLWVAFYAVCSTTTSARHSRVV